MSIRNIEVFMSSMKNGLLLALTLAAVAMPAVGQNGERRLKVLDYDGTTVEIFNSVDSITFSQIPLFGQSANELTVNDVYSLIPKIYPVASPAFIEEISSDNIVDNNVEVPDTDLIPYTDIADMLYRWEDVTGNQYAFDDTPFTVWSEYMECLAYCDYLLKAIDCLPTDLSPLEGEVRLMRAYLKLSLKGVFITDYDDADIKIDITKGLALLGNANAGNARRMNSNAAHALAARYHLLRHEWAEVEQHATQALGSNPFAKLRQWNEIKDAEDILAKMELYYDSAATANFLVEHTYSLRARNLLNCRYGINGTASRVVLWGSGPNWTSVLPAYSGNVYMSGMGQQYGFWLFRAYEFFEYIDETLGMGYAYCDYTPFTAEETLLMRAEARFYLDDTEGCLADLNLWTQSKQVTAELTEKQIENFYKPGSIYDNPIDMDLTEWSLFDIAYAMTNKALLDCILHFRRIETIHDGLRWQDIQRYGISVSHTSRYPYAYAQTKTVNRQTGYLRKVPSVAFAASRRQLNIHLSGDSVRTFAQWPKVIIPSSDEEADAIKGTAIMQDMEDAPYGWVLHEFHHAGEGTSILFAPDSLVVYGKDFLSVGQYQTYGIVSYTAGQEYQLEGNGGLYPVSRFLMRLDMPWEDYQQRSELMRQRLLNTKFPYRCDDVFLINRSGGQYFNLSHTTEDADRYKHCPIVLMPTGFRFLDEESMGCSPVFVLDTISNTLISQDGRITFTPYWDKYLNQYIMNSTRALIPEIATDEWQQTWDALNTAIKVFSSQFQMVNVVLGRFGQDVEGLGIVFYLNSQHTHTNNAGVSASVKFADGTATIVVDDDFTLSKNAQTLANRSESFLPALQGLAALLAGEYDYEFDEPSGLLRLTKRDASGLVFQIEL